MSFLYPELSLFSRTLGDLFDDFERSFYLPHHTHSVMDLDTLPAVNEQQRQLQQGNGSKQGGGEEMKRGEGEGTGQQQALATQQAGGGRSLIRSPFTSLIRGASGVGDIGIRLDVQEDKDNHNLSISAELPHGVKKGDVNINVRGNVLTISCEKRNERKEEDKDKKYLLQEISYGTASRTIRLPNYVDMNKLQAKYSDSDSRLNITVPKKEESKNTEKKIEIQ